METRGIRNNNPGNIRKGSQWQGLKPTQSDPDFCQFTAMEWGVRALIVTLRTYVTVHNLTTDTQIISRWAPPSDGNKTDIYIKNVRNHLLASCGRLMHLSKDNFLATSIDDVLYLYEFCSIMCLQESKYNLTLSMFLKAYAKIL